jgi:hypothetical protein
MSIATKAVTALLTATSLAALVACGTDVSAAPVAAPAPAPTVTTTVTKTVSQTPAVCLDALDKADEALGTAGEAFTIISAVLSAASQMDVDTMDTETAKLAPLNTRLSAGLDQYKAARDACKGS